MSAPLPGATRHRSDSPRLASENTPLFLKDQTMATTRISDVIVPEEFAAYTVQNSLEKSALVQSGIAVRNGAIDAQLKAGADSFTVPFWQDLGNEEADVVSDDPAVQSVPHKIGSGRQVVRKAFLHSSWAAMNLASELSGSDPLGRIQDRVSAYWQRQAQRRLIATLKGVLADNVANDAGDMVLDISAATGAASKFSAAAVIDTAGTLGDGMRNVVSIAMHSDVYRAALKADLIQTVPDSQGGFIQNFRGLAIVVDDQMPVAAGVYTSVLFGPGVFGYGMSEPRIAAGTEIENLPSSGNGGGQQILHSRVNLALHPQGFSWKETAVAGDSPTIAELTDPLNWDRVIERRAVALAFLQHKL